MIKKIFVIFLCLNLCGCGGLTYRAGLKFKKSVGAETDLGNPSHTTDVLKLDNGKVVSFNRPMGKCGGGIIWFVAVVIPVPVWVHFNNCNKEFIISSNSEEISDLKIKYNDKIYEPVSIEKWEKKHGDKVYMDGKYYTFKIKSFWKFRMAKDKALIVIGEDGFTQELPVKWGVMRYFDWSII